MVLEGSEQHLRQQEQEASATDHEAGQQEAQPEEDAPAGQDVPMEALEGHRKLVPSQIVCEY